MKIRQAVDQDLQAIVQVHMAAFPGFFLTKLGPCFLGLYYETVLAYPQGVLLVAEESGRVVGFVGGFVSPQGFYQSLKRKALLLGLATIPALFRDFRVIQGLFGNFRRVSKYGDTEEASAREGAELASLGVSPAHEGFGIGKALVQHFVESARGMGAGFVLLTTDAVENHRVNGFYNRLGFSLKGTLITASGRLMNEYRIDL